MKFLGLFFVACMAITSTVDAAGVFFPPKEGTPIPGKYIVMLKQNATASHTFENKMNEISRRHRKNNSPHSRRGRLPKISRHFQSLNGFAIENSEDDLQELLDLDEVDYIEQDARFQLIAAAATTSQPTTGTTAISTPTQSFPTSPVPTNTNGTKGGPPNWGLVRITQRDRVDQSCSVKQCARYKYPKKAGAGILAYVLDTGIMAKHPEFEGRVRFGKNFVEESPNTDEHGHGTHVASVLGGRIAGVAKKVTLIDVKILDATGWGNTSDIIAGMDWVRQNARGRRAVVNMSLRTPKSKAVDDAANALAKSNVPVFVAAGNSRKVNSCDTSPSGAQDTFAVASSDVNDEISEISAFGPCIDIIAPGDDIYGATINPSRPYDTQYGTSVATPHVAGAAAVYMSVDRKLRTSTKIYEKLKRTATPGRITGSLRETPNLLLYLS
ncbi:subtilisin-like serine protease [Actinomortierella ambigua]|nr:subtilisin-like serine protease [Actinomortierella ambigua]